MNAATIAINIFIPLMFFLYGICIGSFLNVVIYRLPLEIPVYKGRSFCPKCNNSLHAVDLVPIFSFLFLKGKCRYCGDKISLRYPAFETLTGIMFLLCYLAYGLTWYTIVGCALMSILICIAMIDYDTMIVFDRWHFILLALAVCSYFAQKQIAGTVYPEITLLSRILGSVVVGGGLLILALVTGGVGLGDVKLMAVMGLILGLKLNIMAFFLAYIIAAICMLKPLITKKVKSKTEVPMVPFFAISCATAFLYGDRIISWYFNLF